MRSVGYAELFSLSKEDVLSAVKDYPEAEVNILISYRLLNHLILFIESIVNHLNLIIDSKNQFDFNIESVDSHY